MAFWYSHCHWGLLFKKLCWGVVYCIEENQNQKACDLNPRVMNNAIRVAFVGEVNSAILLD